MKKNININEIDRLTRNTDKLLMQLLAADLKTYKTKNAKANTAPADKQAA